jgi:hypothetical protein
MSAANLRDSLILRDWTVSINGIGKIGMCPSVTIPEFNLEMEDYRGGGMFGTVEIPMGVEKMDFSFDLFTWDADIWLNIGYGAGSQSVPFLFLGNAFTQTGVQTSVSVGMNGTLKSIKTDAAVPGKQVKHACQVAINTFKHIIAGVTVMDVDIYGNKFLVNGTDIMQTSRNNTGFTA